MTDYPTPRTGVLPLTPRAPIPAGETPAVAIELDAGDAGNQAADAGAGLGDRHPLVRRLAPAAGGARLFDTFLAGFPASTAAVYRQRIQAFAAFLGVDPAALAALLVARGPAATSLALREFAATLRARVVSAAHDGQSTGAAARTLAPATRNGYLNAVRAFLRFLQRTQLIAWQAHVALEPTTAYRDTAGPGVPAIARVLRVADAARDPRVAARDVALVSLYADWALRASEPLGLTLGDVEGDARGRPVAVWVQGKGRADRERFALPSATADALARWLAVRATLADHRAPPSDGRGPEPSGHSARRSSDARPLFVALDPAVGRRRAALGGTPAVAPLSRRAVNYLIARLGARAGLARLTPHMLRHTAITAVLDAGASIREAQRFSRHRDPRVLLRYDDNREDLGGRRAAELSARYRTALDDA